MTGWVMVRRDSNTAHRRNDRCEDCIPVVVLDPDSREQAEELIRLFWDNGNDDGDDTRAMQAALRQLANPTPPKAAEPLGLGAVVEAIHDNHFIHVGNGCWFRLGDPDQQTCEYADIDVVRVLSEGVTSNE